MTRFSLLEQLTALVLLLAILAVGWMVLTAYQPNVLRLPSVELEVLLMVALLAAALLLVSVLALLHTRS